MNENNEFILLFLDALFTAVIRSL